MNRRSLTSIFRITTGGRGPDISVGPIHVITSLLVVAAVASGALALSVADDGAEVRSAGGATPGDALVATPLFETREAVSAQSADLGVFEPEPSFDASLTPNATDSDGDGLADAAERRRGTDPTDPDTDGDGIPDGLEVTASELYPDADPLEQDIYIEVDATGDKRISAGAIARVETTFADAPVDNPDGTHGIDAHVLVDDRGLSANDTVYSHNRTGPRNDIYDFRDRAFDARGTGYYYVLLTDNAAYDGDASYVGAGRPGVVVMQTFESPKLTASLFMHELGHAFGLDASADGIDAETYSTREYDSVMNYNGLYEQLSYSDGDDDLGRDEWAFVADERYRPPLGLDN